MSLGNTSPTKKIKSIPQFDECFYHAPCFDGAAAAYVVNKYTNTKKFTGLAAGKDPDYGTDFPTGKRILYVDLCPSMSHLLELMKKENYIMILDHHDTAIKELRTFMNELQVNGLLPTGNKSVVVDHSNTRRSGCGLAFEEFAWNTWPTAFLTILAHIEDRDLWTWKLENTKEICAALHYYYPNLTYKDLEVILDEHEKSRNEWIESLKNGGNEKQDRFLQKWIDEGTILVKLREDRMKDEIKKALRCTVKVNEKTYDVLLSGCPRDLRSEVGEELAKISDFVAIWEYIPLTDVWWISLRSYKQKEGGAVHVGEVAKAIMPSGGGHPNAAGFTIPSGRHLKDIFVPVTK